MKIVIFRHKLECSDPSFERDVEKEDTETNSFNLPQWEIVMHGDDESSSGNYWCDSP